LIARTIYSVVSAGLAAFQANPQIYQNLFGTQWGLSQTEIDGIIATFAKKPVTIRHGYAQADFTPPQVTILLQSEQQSDYLLGDYVGQDTYAQADGTLVTAAQLGSFYDSSFQIICITENVDACAYLFEMVKTTLTIGKDLLEQGGVMDPMLSGMDLAPDGRYLPEHLFARVLNLRCKNMFKVTDFDNALAKALKVGVYLPNKTTYPNGGVPTTVTPTTERIKP
jgi:hypothetical protein